MNVMEWGKPKRVQRSEEHQNGCNGVLDTKNESNGANSNTQMSEIA